MRYFLIAICCLLLFCGCSPSSSEDDIARLTNLQNKYPDFEFTLVDEFYLKAKLLKEKPISENDLIEMYKVFFFDTTNSQRRKTSFVYLNYYNSIGKFQYQLSFDPHQNSFEKSRSEYY